MTTEMDFINFYIRSGCTGMSVSQIAKTVLREYALTPREESPSEPPSEPPPRPEPSIPFPKP